MHENHRERVRGKYLADGMDNWPEHNVLEMLLFYRIPRRDTNPLAHLLIDEFGSLAGVFDAEPEKLMSVKGVGEGTALFLNTISQVIKRYAKDKSKESRLFPNEREEIIQFISNQFADSVEEELMMFFFDGNGKYIGYSRLKAKRSDGIIVNKRDAVNEALKKSARGVILAHGHPDFIATVSNEDIKTAFDLDGLLTSVGVAVHDYIVVSGAATISMYSMSRFQHFFNGRFYKSKETKNGTKKEQIASES